MFTFSFDQLIIQGYMYIFALATSNNPATTHPGKWPLCIFLYNQNIYKHLGEEIEWLLRQGMK